MICNLFLGKAVVRHPLLIGILLMLPWALAVDCESWNTREFFEQATEERVAECLAAGAEISAVNDYGFTPLHLAAKYSDDLGVVQALLDSGADISARDDSGRVAAYYERRRQGFNLDRGSLQRLALRRFVEQNRVLIIVALVLVAFTTRIGRPIAKELLRLIVKLAGLIAKSLRWVVKWGGLLILMLFAWTIVLVPAKALLDTLPIVFGVLMIVAGALLLLWPEITKFLQREAEITNRHQGLSVDPKDEIPTDPRHRQF